MKRIAFLLFAGLLPLAAAAQGMHVDSLGFEARTTFHQQTVDGEYDSHFQGDYFNLQVYGHLTPSLSFRVRQRLNKKIDDANPFNATDFLWLKWQATEKWSFTAGKHPIMVGGYEVDSAPIDVYYYGAFTNRLSQYYAFGVSASYSFLPGQSLSVQFIPSPISPVTQNSYSYNLYWNGSFLPKWKTIWSYNLVEDELHRKMNWVVLGNKFLFGPLAVDVDIIDRFAFGQKNPLTDFSFIVKPILTLGKWNLCSKVGYERNDAANVDPDYPDPADPGYSYDLVLPAGNDYFYYGAGVEYFPLGGENLRLHAAYFRDNHDNINNFDIGLTWRFSAYKRK